MHAMKHRACSIYEKVPNHFDEPPINLRSAIRRPYKLAVQKHSVINLCSITGFTLDSMSKVLIYPCYFSLFNLLYFTMPLTDRFRNPHADVVSELNISLLCSINHYLIHYN